MDEPEAQKEGIWQPLFRWDFLGVLLPAIPLAGGFAMLTTDWFPHNLLISQACFALTGFLLMVKLVGHAIQHNDSRIARVIFATTFSLVIIAGDSWFIWQIQKHKAGSNSTTETKDKPDLGSGAPGATGATASTGSTGATSDGTDRPTRQVEPPKPKSIPPALPKPDYAILIPIFYGKDIIQLALADNSDTVAEKPRYMTGLFNLTHPYLVDPGNGLPKKQEILPLASITRDEYVKGHSLMRGFEIITPAAKPLIAKGDVLFGYFELDCLRCEKSKDYYILWQVGVGGWYAESPTNITRVPIMEQTTIQDEQEKINKLAPPDKRVAFFPDDISMLKAFSLFK
jgi:hypothetical protein